MAAEIVTEATPGLVSLTVNMASPVFLSGGGEACYEACDQSGCDCFDSGDCFDACDRAPDIRPATPQGL